jgi:hypothetical protein
MKESECNLCRDEQIVCKADPKIINQRTVIIKDRFPVRAWNGIENCVKRVQILKNE